MLKRDKQTDYSRKMELENFLLNERIAEARKSGYADIQKFKSKLRSSR